MEGVWMRCWSYSGFCKCACGITVLGLSLGLGLGEGLALELGIQEFGTRQKE
jgi:hypothetical protein